MDNANDNNKGLSAAVLITAILALLISAMSLYFIISVSNQILGLSEDAAMLSQSVADLSVTTAEEQIFILREYEGVIGIFDSAGVLTDIISVQIVGLPETDRQMLHEGIYAFSRAELIALIEDYTG